MTDLAAAPTATTGLTIQRRHTTEGIHPFDTVQWENRSANVGAFRQDNVEFPATWSQNATNIVAQKYFRGPLDSPTRERSVKQMISRVAGTITDWGRDGGYFNTPADADAFEAELTWLLVHQHAAFNSPVWFNVGFEEQPQCSACFILSVQDELASVLEWNTREGRIFEGGSGSGVNLSAIRGSMEPLSKGGTASGPVSFMRGADSWAGTIKSGGKTRRAAKMVVLDVDHPDIVEFIECKAREEDKAAALAAAGFDMGMDGRDIKSIQYQNANNSVRLSDAFLQAAENEQTWQTTGRVSGQPVGDAIPARELLRKIAQAAWRCADPGIQYDGTIQAWHTCPNSGRINASNPCSEYMHVDDSACNLASINLLAFRPDKGGFDVDAFRHCVDILFLAQEILVDRSSYPDERIARNAHRFRQLGIGYANLGAYLMAEGMPYDSHVGRARAAAITALMTGRAYKRSAQIAAVMGAYDAFAENVDAHIAVLEQHYEHLTDGPYTTIASTGDQALAASAEVDWRDAIALARTHGVRNAQASLLAPTGTISFLMDCDTTGVEPGFSLVTYKDLVGGGSMVLPVRVVPIALATLGYTTAEIDAINAHIAEHGSIVGAPGLREQDLAVFDVAVGERAISPDGHLQMMAAVQPFLSGAISKTINLPADTTVEQIEQTIIDGWKLGLKAIALYRDGSKTAQALHATPTTDADVDADVESIEGEVARRVEEQIAALGPMRRKMPRQRNGTTTKFTIGDQEGYLTVNHFEDGQPGELFINDCGKEGSTLRGVMSALATSLSLNLQYGVPLDKLVEKFSMMRFEPSGRTGDPEIPAAQSLVDYVIRKVAALAGDVDLCEEYGILTPAVRERKIAQLDAEHGAAPIQLAGSAESIIPPPSAHLIAAGSRPRERRTLDGDICKFCGSSDLWATGTCKTCRTCGTSSGGCS